MADRAAVRGRLLVRPTPCSPGRRDSVSTPLTIRAGNPEKRSFHLSYACPFARQRWLTRPVSGSLRVAVMRELGGRSTETTMWTLADARMGHCRRTAGGLETVPRHAPIAPRRSSARSRAISQGTSRARTGRSSAGRRPEGTVSTPSATRFVRRSRRARSNVSICPPRRRTKPTTRPLQRSDRAHGSCEHARRDGALSLAVQRAITNEYFLNRNVAQTRTQVKRISL
jgi:hypothetical protein